MRGLYQRRAQTMAFIDMLFYGTIAPQQLHKLLLAAHRRKTAIANQ
jgi:hypothetical protein